MTNQESATRDFGFNEDAAMLREVAQKLLAERLPLHRLRSLVAAAPEPVYEQGARAAWDRDLWAEMVGLGWSGLAIAEADGGAEIPLVAIAGMIEQVGRHALPSPLIATLSASMVLRAASGAVAQRVMAQIAEGKTASLALINRRGSWEPDDTELTAVADGDGLMVNGTACFVQDAFKADYLVASARHAGQFLLFVVPTDAAGVTLVQDHIHDLTRDQAHVQFSNLRIGADAVITHDGLAALHAAWPRLMVLIAADLCGAAEWLLQTTTDYARERVQFDRPIGFFQAVKHPLVNAMVKIDEARSLLYHACAEIDAGGKQAVVAAHMAKAAASDAAAFISDRAIQLHGGIGFTWEHGLHIYFKRNLHHQALMGDGVHHRRKLAELLIGPIGQPATAL